MPSARPGVMPVWRTRIAVGLVSLAVILLELTLMRALALRFWNHFAHMVVAVALLGFGASGTFLVLARRRILGRERSWLFALCIAFSLSVPLAPALARAVPLDCQSLAWDLFQVVNILAIEFLMFVPFVLAATVVGIVLMDRPERVGGHYAANLLGSGAGAVVSILLMYVLSTRGCLLAAAAAGYVAGVLFTPRRRRQGCTGSAGSTGYAGRLPCPSCVSLLAAVGAAVLLAAWLAPLDPAISQYKMLSLVRNMPGTQVIHRAEGPLGRIEVVAGPSLHHAPGLGLRYAGTPPAHVLVIVDGDQTSAVYDCRSAADWAFLDHTIQAAAFHLREDPKVLVIGAGGGADIGLALFHESPEVVALEMNPQIIDIMTGPLAGRGGGVYESPGVKVVNQEARGFLASTEETFDVTQLPAIDAFGASGAGLYAAQESYLYTVESFEAMLGRLGDGGVLCVTRWARTPPRDGLKVFDTAARALRRMGLEPSQHLAMIRSWATVAVLVFKKPIARGEADALRGFCERRGFDLCFLPGLERSDTNRFHVLDRPYYFEGARALLGPGRADFGELSRAEFLDRYPFKIAAATDDRPYFFHFFRARAVPFLREQLGGRSRAFLELGLVMLLAALVQVVLMAVLLILLPLAPSASRVKFDGATAAALGYFLLLGAGFMLLEMGFLQRLILYLAHPIFSAAAVISSFLVFGGLGSALAGRWRAPHERVAAIAAGAVVCLAVFYLVLLGGWLGLTQAQPVLVRIIIASLTTAPLAFAMGHMFPMGLRLVGESRPELVPWAWAVNGFASVAATVAAPLAAMSIGFSGVVCASVACYALAGLLYRLLPGRE